MKRLVMAFHGQTLPFMDGSMLLKRDVGDLSNQVQHFFRGHDLELAVRRAREAEACYLIGYSYGGAVIAGMTHHLKNIAGACLYESPVFPRRGLVPSFANARDLFPALQIWNKGRRGKSSKAAQSESAWAWRRDEYESITSRNVKGHMTLFPPAHKWDHVLNSAIVSHMEMCFGR